MKKRKALKTALAISQLLLAVALLISATAAWFSMSTAPEVRNVKLAVSTTPVFEIALARDAVTQPLESSADDEHAADNNYRWGEKVDLSSSPAIILNAPATVITSGGLKQLCTVKYDNEKRTDGTVPLTEKIITENGGISYLVSGSALGIEESEILNCAGGVAVWLRCNVGAQTAARSPVTVSASSISVSRKIPVGVAFKTGNKTIMAEKASGGEYTATLFEGTSSDYMVPGTAYLVEVLVYYEGSPDKGGLNSSYYYGTDPDAMNISADIGTICFSNPAVPAE